MEIKLLHFLGWLLGIAPSLASDEQRRAICERLVSIRARIETEGMPFVIRRFLEISLSCFQRLRRFRASGFRWVLGWSAMGLFFCYLIIALGGIFGALSNMQPTLPWNVYDRSIDAARTTIKSETALAALPQFKGTEVIQTETRYLNAYIAHYNGNVRIAFSAAYILVVCLCSAVLWRMSLICSELVLGDVLRSPQGTSIFFALVGVSISRFLIWIFALGFFGSVEAPSMWPTIYATIAASIAKSPGNWLGSSVGVLAGMGFGVFLATPDWFVKFFGIFTLPLRAVNWLLILAFLMWVLGPLLAWLLGVFLKKTEKWISGL
jgi:hypothetical protein